MSDPTPPPPETAGPVPVAVRRDWAQFPWFRVSAAVAVILFGALGYLAYLRTLSQVGTLTGQGLDLARQLVTNAPTIAERFRTGRITQTFRSGIPEINSTHGDVLELAVSRSDETFTRTDERRVAWDWIYLGTTETEIRVPVSFRYHLRLSDPWHLATRGQVCLVRAPAIRPSLPPAIHTEGMEKRLDSGWARFDGNQQLAELERSLTGTLALRAMDPAHLGLVREACRRSVAAYVRNWLLREDHWRHDRFTTIVVVFADEVSDDSDETLVRELPALPPTLLLGE